MVDQDEIQALAAGTPSAPARVVALDAACEYVGLEAPAAELEEAREQGCHRTLRLAGAGEPGLMLSLLGSLSDTLGREGERLAPEALAVPALVAEPDEYALGAVGRCAGRPAVYLLLPAAALEAIQRRRPLPLGSGAECDARTWWQRLLALVAEAPTVSLVPEAPGPGLSLLAPRQRWLGPSPGSGELIPASPCRLRLVIDFGTLLRVSDDRPAVLASLAGRVVAAADELLDRVLAGSGPRRLALELDGIARAVVGAGRDPRHFSTLEWVKSRLKALREGACAESIRLAHRRGEVPPLPLPAPLEVADAGELDRARLVHGARHTHLLCLSPWSLAPPELGRDGFGLLPALACADSLSWRRPAGDFAVSWYDAALRFAWAVALRS
jgi:hypothetical protein